MKEKNYLNGYLPWKNMALNLIFFSFPPSSSFLIIFLESQQVKYQQQVNVTFLWYVLWKELMNIPVLINI